MIPLDENPNVWAWTEVTEKVNVDVRLEAFGLDQKIVSFHINETSNTNKLVHINYPNWTEFV